MTTRPADLTPDASLANHRPIGKLARKLLLYTALLLLTLVFVAPLVWMLVTSLKSNSEAIRLPLSWIPENPTLDAYRQLFDPGSRTPVLRWLGNSLVAASLHALLVLALAAPAAYALARMDFRGRGVLFGVIIATLFIPGIIFLTPNYLIVERFGWLDTLWAIVVPGAADAFGVFLLRQFFMSLPRELEEAAVLDGASAFEVFWRIILPLSQPALVTLLVLSFLQNWNGFLWPIYVLFSPERLTLPPGLSILQGSYTTDYAILMAGGVVASAPVLLLFIFVQRYVIQGVATSGLKG